MRDHTGRERFAFEQVEFVPTALSKTEGKDRQLRWGLSALKIERFRYSGAFPADGERRGRAPRRPLRDGADARGRARARAPRR